MAYFRAERRDLKQILDETYQTLEPFRSLFSKEIYALLEHKILGYNLQVFRLIHSRLNQSYVHFVAHCFGASRHLRSKDFRPTEFAIDTTASRSTPLVHTRYLFVASMNNYLNPLFSFFNVLEARGERFSVILPREARTWSNFPKLKSYTCIQFCEPENFLKDDELLRCQTRRRSYEESYGTGRKKFRETFQKRFFPAPFFLDRGLENLIKETAPFAEVCLDLAQECLDRIQPQFIVSCRLRRVFDSAFFVAKSNALRVGVIHGLISSTPSMLFDDGSYEHQDVIFVWDDVQEQIVSLKRKNDAKIHFIKECTLKSPVHYATDRSFRLARIVLTTQTPGDLGVAKILSKIVRSLGIKLAVKVHPNESDEPFKKLAASGAFDLIPKTMPFADVIRDDDLVVTSYSTTFYDALLAGVPVIIFQDKRNFLGPYYERGLPHANNTRQLRSLLARVLSNGYDPKVFEIVKRPEPRSNPIQLLEMHFATRDAR